MKIDPTEVAMTALSFLQQGDETEAANVLARCEVTIEEGYNSFGERCHDVFLIGDRKAYQILRDYQSPQYNQIRDSLAAALGEEDFNLIARFAVSVRNIWKEDVSGLPSSGVIDAEYKEVD